eukprot:TRINITY_DN32018_c0_g1_i1.p1 TRINITY_DN32018_c0_g1~~TRINITY_DN32018_c0_g1_i1.p1  ORF type:complete len:388 (+),score=210.68 TRINITY_DN32018_c0_g1_i1:88-1251(+)
MALTFMDGLAAKLPAVAEDCKTLGSLFEKRYWHEMMEALEGIVKKPEWDDAEVLLSLYENFITHFELKVNTFSLARLLLGVSQRQSSAEKALQLLSDVALKMKEGGDVQAYHLLRCGEAIRRVAMGEQQKRVAKDVIEESVGYLNARDASSVHVDLRAEIYLAEAMVFKLEKDYDAFYPKCLLYIAHVTTANVPVAKQQAIAFDLSVAALLAKKVHNFGELINHPILDTLADSPHAWLAELLRIFNAGNIDAYSGLCDKNKAAMVEVLGADSAPFLQEKIQLSALLQHLFVTPVSDRTLSFASIQAKCKCDTIDGVEPLLLKALALGLIKGLINEVDQVIEVTWIAARVLGQGEVSELIGHIKGWQRRVNTTLSEAEATMAMYEQEK